MKNLKRIGGLLCLATVIALVGCGGNNTPATTTPAQTTTTTTGATQTQKFTVTFNAQGGSAVQAQEVNAGQKATKPADPSKEGFEFDGWYKEAACENVFDFATETVSANVTVYAGWIDSSSATTKTAKFYWNYTGAPAEVYDTKTFKDGGRITNKPTDPTRTGYVFDGWYKEAACTNAFAPNAKYTGDQNFYARWLKAFTMEAEDTQLTGITPTIENQGVVSQSGDKLGSNFSGNVSGKNLIRADENSSGGKFVCGCMNLEEGYLDFEFTADKADDNAILELKVCAEFWGFVLTPETFKVLVNPEDNDDTSIIPHIRSRRHTAQTWRQPLAHRHRLPQQACIAIHERMSGKSGRQAHLESDLPHHQRTLSEEHHAHYGRPYQACLRLAQGIHVDYGRR